MEWKLEENHKQCNRPFYKLWAGANFGCCHGDYIPQSTIIKVQTLNEVAFRFLYSNDLKTKYN